MDRERFMSRRAEQQGKVHLPGIFVPFWLLLVLPFLVWAEWEGVTEEIEARPTRPFYNFTDGNSFFTASLGNNGDAAYEASVRLAVDGINPAEVTVRNAHELTDGGLSYYEVSNLLGDGYLEPVEVGTAQRIKLDNPRRQCSTIRFLVEIHNLTFQNTLPRLMPGLTGHLT